MAISWLAGIYGRFVIDRGSGKMENSNEVGCTLGTAESSVVPLFFVKEGIL